MEMVSVPDGAAQTFIGGSMNQTDKTDWQFAAVVFAVVVILHFVIKWVAG